MDIGSRITTLEEIKLLPRDTLLLGDDKQAYRLDGYSRVTSTHELKEASASFLSLCRECDYKVASFCSRGGWALYRRQVNNHEEMLEKAQGLTIFYVPDPREGTTLTMPSQLDKVPVGACLRSMGSPHLIWKTRLTYEGAHLDVWVRTDFKGNIITYPTSQSLLEQYEQLYYTSEKTEEYQKPEQEQE